jgi:hypothetical protein
VRDAQTVRTDRYGRSGLLGRGDPESYRYYWDVAIGIGQHDMALIRELTDVDVPGSLRDRSLNHRPLVLE